MAKATRKQQPNNARIFSKQTNLMHDLYKLGMARCKKYIGFAEDGHRSVDPARNPSDWVSVEHCHFFHTIDSRGREQNKCTPTNGHFHEMELVQEATETDPAVYRFGPAKKFVFDKMSNRKIIVDVPFDNHTHEAIYLRSEQLQPRNLSAEAAQKASQFIASTVPPEPAPVAGISG